MKKVYHLSSCKTCQKIIKLLPVHKGIDLQDIKAKPLSEKQVDELKNLAGTYQAIFSKKAIKYRSLGLNNQVLTESDYKKYLLMDYTFLKRPVIVVNSEIFIGNAKAQVDAAIKAIENAR
jgi:arsenate reductase